MGAGTRAGARARAEAGDWGRRGGGQQIWGYQGVWDDEPCQERASASRRSLQLPAVATAKLSPPLSCGLACGVRAGGLAGGRAVCGEGQELLASVFRAAGKASVSLVPPEGAMGATGRGVAGKLKEGAGGWW